MVCELMSSLSDSLLHVKVQLSDHHGSNPASGAMHHVTPPLGNCLSLAHPDGGSHNAEYRIRAGRSRTHKAGVSLARKGAGHLHSAAPLVISNVLLQPNHPCLLLAPISI
jgi:hypothetical protein